MDLRVLIIEDSQDDLELLLIELRRGGYKPTYRCVTNRAEMERALDDEQWDVILSDYSLPAFSGPAALAVWKQRAQDLPFIVVSGMIGEEAAVEMMKAGASDYLMKGRLARLVPAIQRELREALTRRERRLAETSLRQSEQKFASFMDVIPVQVFIIDHEYRMMYANRMVQDMLQGRDWRKARPEDIFPANLVQFAREAYERTLSGEVLRMLQNVDMPDGKHSLQLLLFPIPGGEEGNLIGGIGMDVTDRLRSEQAVKQANEELARAYDATLQGWSRALELWESETSGHSHRVVSLTLELARELGVPEDHWVDLRRGALLHDIGKMGVPDSILRKPGPLTSDEWVIMRMHPEYANQVLEPIEFLTQARQIPYCHHERWDGSGYPQGLVGEAIPLAARIFAVIDVWDALISTRPYRPAWTKAAARHYLQDQSGKQFDPRVVQAFFKMLDK
jgi:putative nucleotidyltransferase with HDIG domain/PAS domain S-box-containing protein